jgi:pimeloyl-ACP methyl ester carboxylesterase
MMNSLSPNSHSKRVVAIVAGIVAGAISGVVYSRYRRDIRQARARVSTGSEIANTVCGPIELAVAGEGPPVLVVHGAGGGYDQGLDFAKPLAEQGFRTIAMSRFGYLRTPLPADASASAQADAHACLLDTLGIERAAVAAASAGAPSAMQFALRHPTRCGALVLLVPAAYAPRPHGAPPLQTPAQTEFLFSTALRFDLLFWAAMRCARSLMIEAILATPLAVVENASSEERTRLDQVLKHVLPISPRRQGLLNDAAIVSTLERYELERIAVPTLVIGIADCLFGTFAPARYTAEHTPGARFIQYETGGHLWVGHHREIVGEIAAFLKEAPATRSVAVDESTSKGPAI